MGGYVATVSNFLNTNQLHLKYYFNGEALTSYVPLIPLYLHLSSKLDDNYYHATSNVDNFAKLAKTEQKHKKSKNRDVDNLWITLNLCKSASFYGKNNLYVTCIPA